MQMIQVY